MYGFRENGYLNIRYMDFDTNSLYYSKKDNLLVVPIGLTMFDKSRVHYTIVNERDSEYCDETCTVDYFKENFKRVGWIQE